MLESQGVEVLDRGNLQGPGNPGLPPVDGYRHLAEVTAWNRAVHDAVHAELAASRLPILLGGDHCLAIGSISAVARHCRETAAKLRVLWFDAHADFNTNVLTPSGNIHGMPMACCAATVRRSSSGSAARCRPSSRGVIRQIGIRSVDDGEKRFVHEIGLEVFDMRYIDEMGMRQTMELALAGLDRNTHLHVSFDVDFLDPDIAPGVGTTVAGGPSYRESQLCMEMIADTGLLGSVDIMELNPGVRRAQQDGGSRRRPDRFAVRQEHADAARGKLVPATSSPRRHSAIKTRPWVQSGRGRDAGLTAQRAGLYNRGPFRPPAPVYGWGVESQ